MTFGKRLVGDIKEALYNILKFVILVIIVLSLLLLYFKYGTINTQNDYKTSTESCPEIFKVDRVNVEYLPSSNLIFASLTTKDNVKLRIEDCRKGTSVGENVNYIYCSRFDRYSKENISSEGIVENPVSYSIASIIFNPNDCIENNCKIIELKCPS